MRFAIELAGPQVCRWRNPAGTFPDSAGLPAILVVMRPALRRRSRQWSRAAWALAALFATLPLSSRLFLGVWGFESAGALASLCAVLAIYLHIQSRRALHELPDTSLLLDEAIALSRSGHVEQAEAVLTEIVRVSPWV